MCIHGRHACTFALHWSPFPNFRFKISTSFMFLILSGTIFHTLDAKYHKEFKAKGAVLRELTEKSRWGL